MLSMAAAIVSRLLLRAQMRPPAQHPHEPSPARDRHELPAEQVRSYPGKDGRAAVEGEGKGASSAAKKRLLRQPGLVATGTVILAGSAALLLALRIFGLGNHWSAQSFTIVFTAIVIEALPFVLLGAFVSALLEVYVPDRAFARLGRLPVALQLPAAAVGGFALPVCECGSVPVARRLIAKGLHPSAGLAFMVAAPILNPVVLGSTWVAYEARGLGMEMLLGRASLGLLVALAAGWAIGADRARQLLRPYSASGDLDQHDSLSCPQPTTTRIQLLADHVTNDFFYMGRFLILGATLAAAIQVLVPQNFLAEAALSPLFASLALMVVAFISSLCSEADAFVAVSFTPLPLGSQLAFLVFGPVLDLKLFFLYGAVFRKGMIASLAVVAIPLTLAGSLWFELMMR
jgi:uncharacterized protein